MEATQVSFRGAIHTVEYDSALKRRGTVMPAAAWVRLEDIRHGEISSTQKDGGRGLHYLHALGLSDSEKHGVKGWVAGVGD